MTARHCALCAGTTQPLQFVPIPGKETEWIDACARCVGEFMYSNVSLRQHMKHLCRTAFRPSQIGPGMPPLRDYQWIEYDELLRAAGHPLDTFTRRQAQAIYMRKVERYGVNPTDVQWGLAEHAAEWRKEARARRRAA